MRNSHAFRQLRGKRPVCPARLWLQRTVQEERLKVLSVSTSENLSDTFPSQADADRCYQCMNFYMGCVGSSRHRKLENHMKSRSTEFMRPRQTLILARSFNPIAINWKANRALHSHLQLNVSRSAPFLRTFLSRKSTIRAIIITFLIPGEGPTVM